VVVVTSADDGSRPYRSRLRAEQAEQTRLRIAHAARQCFVERGWTGTSVRSVATSAGVSEATVYAVYGTKAGLATSLVDSADDDADIARTLRELAAAVGDPTAQLAAQVRFERRLFENAGDALRVIVEGQRSEPALQAAYAEGRGRGERTRREVFATWPASAFRSGMTLDRALDLVAITVSIQTFDIATRERGWTPDQTEQWWIATLSSAILA
jgi:AcrR family transcriptional regulator